MCTLNLGIRTLSQLSTIHVYMCIYDSHQGIMKLVGRDFVLRLHRVYETSARSTIVLGDLAFRFFLYFKFRFFFRLQ